MSGPWEQYAQAAPAGPWTQFAAPQEDSLQTKAEGTAKAAVQGATFGFGDEAKAAVHAAIPGMIELFNRDLFSKEPQPDVVSHADTFGQRYDENLAKVRGSEKQFAEAHPNLDTAGKIGGAVASAATALPAAVTRAAPTFLGNVAKTAAVGGGLGAATGFGEGEGDLGGRLASAFTGGVGGAAVGGAIPVAGLAGRAALESTPGRYVSEKIVSPAIRATGNALGFSTPIKSLSAAAPDGSAGVAPSLFSRAADATGNISENSAIERLATALQRGGLSTQGAQRDLQRLGPEAVLADVDPQIRSMAVGAKVANGQTRTLAENIMQARDRQTGNRLTSVFEGGEAPPSGYALRGEGQAFDKNAQAVGSRAYGEMVANNLVESDEMKALAQVPAVKAAITQVQQDLAHTGQQLSPIEIAHRVKQTLNKTADAAFMSGKAVNKADIGALADRWETAFRSANPSAAVADARFAQAKSLPDFFDSGAALLKREGTSENALETSAAALGDRLPKADAQQALAARVGATVTARNQAQESNALARALAKRVDESAPVQSKIQQLYNPAHAANIIRQAEAEGRFAKTSNALLSGSQTAEKAADVAGLGNAGITVRPGSAVPKFFEHFGDMINRMAGPNEAVRDSIGRITLNQNPAENQRILAIAEALLKQRAQGRVLAPAASEAIAQALGGQ